MYVVAGVSGRSGGAAAEALLRAGQPIKVLVRDAARAAPWRSRGAEVAVASLDDERALARALEGAAGAYLLSPQDLRSTDPVSDGWRIADAIARAVEQSGLPHLVLLSSAGADLAEGTGLARTLHAAEVRLAGAPAATTFLRAAFFLDNLAPVVGAAAATGVLPVFFPVDRPMPMVATADIGVIAARCLIEGEPAGRRAVVDVRGPREVSPRDLAAALAPLLGRPVTAEQVPLDAVVPTFTQMGASPAFAGQVRELFQALIDGRVERSSDRLVRGTTGASDFFAGLLAGGQP